ncbi:MAG: helix-turn-helix domain-containing protein [Nitrososphaeraceae archaeon]
MDRKQKVALVLALAEKGRTYREIAKEAGVSPNTIKAILNRAGLDQTTSISARVFELYAQQKNPLQVAIILGLKAEDAIRYHQEYFMLLGCTEFTKVYPKIKDNPWPYLNLVKLALDSGMGDGEVVELLRIANNDLPSVKHNIQKLEGRESILKTNIQQVEQTLQELNDRTSEESKRLKEYRSIYNQIKEETENLNTKKARLESIINSFHTSNETYNKIKQMIQQEIESTISNPRLLLQFAIASIFESSRKHPGRLQAMYYNMPTIRTTGRSSATNAIGDSPCQDNQYEEYLSEYAREYDAWENMLLNEAELLYNRMVGESMNMCSNEMTSNTKSSLHQSLQPLAELPEVQHGQATEGDYYSNSYTAENDLLPTKVVCNKTDPQIEQDEENNVDVTNGFIRVGKNEINLRI